MYTNIEIDDCLERISTFLSTIWDKIECAAVTSAMEIVMRNNRMRFGDLIFPQIRVCVILLHPLVHERYCCVQCFYSAIVRAL